MDDFTTAIATALVSKGTDALIAGGKSAIDALIRLVRARFGSGTREANVLQAAIEQPENQDRRADLVQVLGYLIAEDPVFRDQVHAYWRSASVPPTATDNGVINNFSGTAGKVVQTRDVHGDVIL